MIRLSNTLGARHIAGLQQHSALGLSLRCQSIRTVSCFRTLLGSGKLPELAVWLSWVGGWASIRWSNRSSTFQPHTRNHKVYTVNLRSYPIPFTFRCQDEQSDTLGIRKLWKLMEVDDDLVACCILPVWSSASEERARLQLQSLNFLTYNVGQQGQ